MFYSFFKIVYKKMWERVSQQDQKTKSTEIKPENVIVEEKIFELDNKKLGFNLYYGNNKKEKLPVIFDIHGGGWAYGDKDSNDNFCKHLANEGFNVVSFSYTLAFKAKLVDMLREIDAFLIYLYSKRETYLLDFDNLFLTGDSAGGELSFLYTAILKNKELQDIYEIYSNFKINAIALNHAACYVKDVGNIEKSKFLTKIGKNGMKKMLFGEFYNLSKIYERCEPQEVLTSSFVPTLLITSTGDKAFRYQTLKLATDLEKFHIKYEISDLNNDEALHIYNVFFPNLDYSIETNKKMIDFFKKNLKNS